jgi:hypothetical protein
MKTLAAVLLIIIVLFVLHALVRRPCILIIGRGPSALTTSANESRYDRVIRLKQCRCDAHGSSRCDILVFADIELYYQRNEYDVFRCLRDVNEIWYFNMFNRGEGDETFIANDPELLRARVRMHQIDNEYLASVASPHGFERTCYPRLTTGMAAIVEALRVFPKHRIDLVGFDNLVNDADVGEFDHPERKNGWSPTGVTTQTHNLHMEHRMLKGLVAKTRRIRFL